jgi:hypothetical membrane protein
MKTDDWKLHYTYLGLLVIAMIALAYVFLKIDEITPETLMALVTFILGNIIGFLTGAEASTRAARSTERATAQGAASAAAVEEEKK